MKANISRRIVTLFVVAIWLSRWAWPASPMLDTTSLVLLAFIILIWYGPRLFKSMTLPGGLGVTFPEDEAIRVEAKAKVEQIILETGTEKTPIKWEKVATLFWLGNDLMWIKDMIFRNAPPERILEGVENVLQYLQDLGFEKRLPGGKGINFSETISPTVG